MSKQNSYGQDLLILKSGEKVEIKIISISKRNITFYKWEGQGGEVHEINRKFIKWYRPESWIKDRISFSFSFGAIPYCTSSSLKKFMKDNGYEGNVSSWFGGSTKYPRANVKIPWTWNLNIILDHIMESQLHMHQRTMVLLRVYILHPKFTIQIPM